jgi:hypothetical protein
MVFLLPATEFLLTFHSVAKLYCKETISKSMLFAFKAPLGVWGIKSRIELYNNLQVSDTTKAEERFKD